MVVHFYKIIESFYMVCPACVTAAVGITSSIPAIIAWAFGASATLASIKYYFFSTPSYKPFSTIEESHKLQPLTSAKCIVDNDGDNLIKALPQGSNIFSKGGLNYIIGSEQPDNFFFSLCSTKPRDLDTTVIDNFNAKEDAIYFFCTKKIITSDKVTFSYNADYNTTVLKVDAAVISIIGEHDLGGVIHLNEKWQNYIDTHPC